MDQRKNYGSFWNFSFWSNIFSKHGIYLCLCFQFSTPSCTPLGGFDTPQSVSTTPPRGVVHYQLHLLSECKKKEKLQHLFFCPERHYLYVDVSLLSYQLFFSLFLVAEAQNLAQNLLSQTFQRKSAQIYFVPDPLYRGTEAKKKQNRNQMGTSFIAPHVQKQNRVYERGFYFFSSSTHPTPNTLYCPKTPYIVELILGALPLPPSASPART